MSFFDKIGEAFGWVKDTAAPAIGGALSGAEHWVDETPGLNAVYGAVNPVHVLVTNPVTAPVADQGASAVGTGFSYGVSRPLSTFTQQTLAASQSGASTGLLWNTDDWRKAWNASEDVSPGQALVITNPFVKTGLNFDMTPDAMAARQQFFHNTWQGQVSSGAVDLALNLGADPTLLATRAVKGAAVARNTFKDAAERDLVFQVHAGEAEAPSQRIGRLANRLDTFLRNDTNGSAAEIMAHPIMKGADQQGALSTMLERANQEFPDIEARVAAKRNILGAAMGNEPSIRALKDQHAVLATELQRLSDTPMTTQAVGNFTWDDHGQGMLDIANATVPPEVSAHKDAIEQELLRLEQVTSATHSVNRVAGTLKEQFQYNQQLNQLRQSTIQTGLGSMPIRVIGGAISNRIPGFVSTTDPVSGYGDLQNTLKQAQYLTGPQKQELLDSYANASTKGQRQDAIYAAEGAIVGSTAKQYGLSNVEARNLLRAGKGRYKAISVALSSRLYSAAPEDKFVHLSNPEDGEVVAWSKPILQSQIEDNVGLIDPRQLDKALRANTHNRLMERLVGQTGVDATGFAPSAYNVAGSSQMVASSVLTGITRVWKDLALMRLAYPMRVQVDSQMRNMTHMGALSYLTQALPSALEGQAHYLFSRAGGDGSTSLFNLFRGGDIEGAMTKVLRRAEIPEDDIPEVIRSLRDSGGGASALVDEVANRKLAQFRATGEWGYVDPRNQGWAPAYVRAVNRQIRNSPTAMKLAEGASDDELKKFIQTDMAGRREWMDLKSSYNEDPDEWLTNLRTHVDHYLPTAEMKLAVAGKAAREGREITPSGLKLHRVDAEGTGLADPAGKPQGLYFSVVRDEKTFENPHASWVRKRAGGRVEEHRAYALPDGDRRVLTVDSEGGDSGLMALKKLMPGDEFDRLSGVADRGKRALAEDLSKKYPDVDWAKYPTTGDMFTTLGGVVAREHGYAAIHAPSNGMMWGLHDPYEEYVALTDEGLAKPVSIPAEDGLPGRAVTQEDVAQWFKDPGSRMFVHGESLSATSKNPWVDWYNRGRNGWYTWAAEAPEDVMARAPMYAYAYKRTLKDLVNSVADGEIIDAPRMDQFRQTAKRLARREVGRILYDTSHSSNLSHSMRFVSPFFAAWEDMGKKWGTLFYDKPWTGVRFEQAWGAPNEMGVVVDENGNQVDAEGNRYEVKKDKNGNILSLRKLDPVKDKYLIGKREQVVVPLSFVPKSIRQATGWNELRLDKNSFNIVFQGDPMWLPGGGPLVQVPVNEMVKHGFIKNTDSPIVQALLPYGVSDSPIQDQVLPSWARNAKTAFFQSGQDWTNTRAMLTAQETEKWHNHERATEPTADEIDNMTRNWFIMKAISSDTSPVSVKPGASYQYYVDMWHIYKQKYNADWSKANGGKTAEDMFYQDFPDYFRMSLSLSENESGISATENAVGAANSPTIRALVRKDPEYGWAAVGPSNLYGNTPGSAFSQTAYVQEESLGLRGQSDPATALAKVEAQKGWMQYNQVMTKLDLALRNRGLHSFQQKGAEDLAGLKSELQNALGASNQSWLKDFLNTDDSKVVGFLNWANGATSIANRPDMVAIKRYTELRGIVQNVLAGRNRKSLDDPSNADIKSIWDQGSAILRSDNIGFQQAWNRILQHDDPSKKLIGLQEAS